MVAKFWARAAAASVAAVPKGRDRRGRSYGRGGRRMMVSGYNVMPVAGSESHK